MIHPSRVNLLVLLAICSALLLLGCQGSDEKLPPQNILLVTVDTLRSDHLHCYGYPQPISPSVDALAEKGILFLNCRAHSSSTAPSLASLMTGVYPSEAGVLSNRYPLKESANTMAMAMQERGYRTAAFVSNYNLRPNMNFSHGFDHYDAELIDYEVNRQNILERTAEKTTDAAIKWIGEHTEKEGMNFYAWLHYQDPHGPYTPPKEMIPDLGNYTNKPLPFNRDNWTPGGIPFYQVNERRHNKAQYEARYDGEILFFDRHFKRLMDFLEEKNLDETTAVIFTADHGESMGEHGYWFCHGQDLFDELVRVPLIVYVPGMDPEQCEDSACHMDLFPTLMALTGLETSASEQYRGWDLLAFRSSEEKRYIYAEAKSSGTKTILRSIVSYPWKLISVAPTKRARDEVKRKVLLYNLKKDPGETSNLAGSNKDVARKLQKILLEEEKRSSAAQKFDPLHLSKKDLEAMKSLGYTGG